MRLVCIVAGPYSSQCSCRDVSSHTCPLIQLKTNQVFSSFLSPPASSPWPGGPKNGCWYKPPGWIQPRTSFCLLDRRLFSFRYSPTLTSHWWAAGSGTPFTGVRSSRRCLPPAGRDNLPLVCSPATRTVQRYQIQLVCVTGSCSISSLFRKVSLLIEKSLMNFWCMKKK